MTKEEFKNLKVGDIIIGNEKANTKYVHTTKGIKGKVIEIDSEDYENTYSIRIYSQKLKNEFNIDPKCFDIYNNKIKKRRKLNI